MQQYTASTIIKVYKVFDFVTRLLQKVRIINRMKILNHLKCANKQVYFVSKSRNAASLFNIRLSVFFLNKTNYCCQRQIVRKLKFRQPFYLKHE